MIRDCLREMEFDWQPDEIEQRRNGRVFIRPTSIETFTIASRAIHRKIVRVVILQKAQTYLRRGFLDTIG